MDGFAALTISEALETALDAASHLTAEHAATIAAARSLAERIDAWDVIVGWALDDAAGRPGTRPAVPQNDNTSLPTFLKYMDALQLVPAKGATIDKGVRVDHLDELKQARQKRAAG